MSTTQETVLKLKATTSRLKTNVAEHEARINKLAAHSDEFIDTYNSHVAAFDKLADETVPKLKTKLKEQAAKIAELFEIIEALRTSQEPLVQGLPQIGKIKMLDTKPTPAPTKFRKSWSLPVVLSIVFLLLGLWIGAATSGDPVAYVGRSEDGARIVLAPVDADADTANPDKMFTWKSGDTRIDPATGKQLRLNVMNWEVVETPKPGRKKRSFTASELRSLDSLIGS